MNPRDTYGLPEWESDFWADLVRDYGPGFGLEEDVDVEPEQPSPYNNGNVIMGEIVEEEPLELTS